MQRALRSSGCLRNLLGRPRAGHRLGYFQSDSLSERFGVSPSGKNACPFSAEISGDMKPRILLIGKSGQLGAELCQVLPSLGEIIAPDSNELDLTKPARVRGAIRDYQPALIINAAAYTAVDRAEQEPGAAHALNAQAPAILAEEALKSGAALIHYSTDYVFDGSKRSPYEETDVPSPPNVYGQSKLAG